MNTTGNLRVSWISAITLGFAIFLFSCDSPSDILSSTDTQNVNSESVAAAYSNEPSDLSSLVVASLTKTQYAGARTMSETISVSDDRLNCSSTIITLTRTGTKLFPSGEILVDFGAGCTDSRGVTRAGQIYIKYSGRRWYPNSYIKDSLVNYYRNGVHIEGTQTITVQVSADTTHLQLNNILVDGKVTFPSGHFITRSHDITRKWVRAALPLNDEWITLTGGFANGVAKDGSTYLMTITQDLVEKRSCFQEKVFIPVSGTEIINVDNKEYTVDYGNGICDNDIVVTFKGQSKTVSVSGDGN